jgi:hypothetical protein
VQTYTFKIIGRSFFPFIGLFIFCHIILILKNLGGRVSLWLYPLAFAGAILFGIYLVQLKQTTNLDKMDLAGYRTNIEKVKVIAANHYLVTNSSSCDFLFLCNTPFHPFDFSAFKRVYITDGYNLPFLPYYRRFLEAECHCNMLEYPSFWDYLRSKHNEVVIYSDSYRMNITKDYLQEIHHYTLPVTEDTSVVLTKMQRSDQRDVFFDARVYRLNE